jgi:hypothetical protein
MKNKKYYERLHLLRFKKAFEDFPEGKIIDCESPDFIIDNGDRKICIEVTKIYKSNSSSGPPMQAIESTCRKIAEAASIICGERPIPPLTVSIHFIHDSQILDVRRDDLSKKIADFVCQNIPQPDTYLSFDHIFGDPNYPEHIHAITIGRFSVLTKHHFNVPTAGWVQEDFSVELQNAIDLKNKKLSQYNNNCTEHWLLIISDGASPSTFFESSGDTRNNVFKSDFDRTFYMEAFSRTLWEMKTE